MKSKNKITCPLCRGKGTYLKGSKNWKEIPKLRKKGLTYREIMKATGLMSLDSVHFYLKRNRKQGRWHLRKKKWWILKLLEK